MNNNFYKNLGIVLRSKRKELGLTVEFVCRNAKISTVNLLTLERGERRVEFLTLLRILKVLNLSLYEIVEVVLNERG